MDGRLAISEIMYAPVAPTGGGAAGEYEYVELQNVGDAAFNLDEFQFTTGITFDFPDMLLEPGQFAVVARNPTLLQQAYGNVPGLISQPFVGVLDNNGEELILQGPAGIVAQFTYDPNWYPNTDAQGFSLVAVTPGATSPAITQKAHWRSSGNPGGSPGVQDGGLAAGAVLINELLSHTDVDAIGDWIELKNTTNAPIDVSGWFLSDNPDEPMRYRIPAGTTIPAGGFVAFTQAQNFGVSDPTNPNSLPFQFSELGDETVILTQADPSTGVFLGYRAEQEIAAADREVSFGRYFKSTGGSDFTALATNTRGAENSGPLIGPIVINELMYEPAVGGDEFIELRNITAQAVPLFHPTQPQSTWRFTGGVDFEFPQGQSIPAGGYALVVGIDPAVFRDRYDIPVNVQIYGPYANDGQGVDPLSNNGEEVLLAKPGDQEQNGDVPYYVVDRVNYDTNPPWPDGTNGGPSLARKVAASYGNDGANWAPGIVGGTPGTSNSTTITISAENATVDETDAAGVQAFVTVRLSDASSQVVTVNFTTQDFEALAPGDYVAQSGVLTFQPGDTVKVVTVAINGDTIDEPNQDFDVVLSNPTGGVTPGDMDGRITITDNDPLPSLTIPDVSAIEGDGGIPSAVITLTLSAPSEKTITLQFATDNVSATSPADYSSASGTITFLPNTPSQTITIPLVGDNVTESNETFVVNFTSPTGVTVADPQVVVTITDDDQPTPPWQNQTSRWDVNNDTTIAALDVLILINRINATGGGALPEPSNGNSPPPYYDVDGNRSLEPLDVLNVINFINAQPSQGLAAMPMFAMPAAEEEASVVVIAMQPSALTVATVDERQPSEQAVTAHTSAAFADNDLPARVACEVEVALDELLG